MTMDDIVYVIFLFILHEFSRQEKEPEKLIPDVIQID